MHGFKGFTDVVSKIKQRLTKKTSIISDDSWAVDVDYNGLPIIEQIHDKIVAAIGRINASVLNVMKVFGDVCGLCLPLSILNHFF